MIQDVVGLVYLLWPITVISLTIFFVAGFLFALSVGTFFTFSLFTFYYVYVYLKQNGFFDWLKTKNKMIGAKLKNHIQETFVLKGNINEIPDGPVLYVAHPHGLFSMAPFLHWAAETTTWPRGRKVHIALHRIFFRIPFVREFCEHFEAIEATDEEIKKVLKLGDSVALLTGGVREISETVPGKMRIYLKKRKGFARVAKELGVPIVPVLTFGENELFPPIHGFWTNWVQAYLRSWLGISLPIPKFESIKHWFQLLQGPLPSQVETWVGKSIEVHEKTSVDTLRAHVFQGFKDLYKRGRPENYPSDIEIL